MSNLEISKLSAGKWSPSTIKYYTPGVKLTQPSPWQNAVALLEAFLKKDPEHPMAKGILAVALCIIEEKEQSWILFDEVKKRGFDCSAYIYEHAIKLKKTGRKVYAAKLVKMAVERGFADQQIITLFNENTSKVSKRIPV